MFAGLGQQVSAVSGVVAAKVGEGVQKTQDRIDTAKEGKRMLDEGGPEVEGKLLAKKTGSDAVALDCSIVAKLADASRIYSDASEQLKASASSAAAEGEGPGLAKLSEDYSNRAKSIAAALEILQQGLPEVPTVSAPEKDAIGILVAKGKYRFAVEKTSEGYNTLKRQATGSVGAA